jgi:hypothetical protein
VVIDGNRRTLGGVARVHGGVKFRAHHEDLSEGDSHGLGVEGTPILARVIPRRAGKQHTKSFKTQIDAKRWVATEESKVVRGDWIDPAAGRVTFAAF